MILKVLEGCLGWALKVDSRELTRCRGCLPSCHPDPPTHSPQRSLIPPPQQDSPEGTFHPINIWFPLGFPVAQLVRIRLQCGRPGFNPWVKKIPWRRDRLPTPVLLGFPCGSAGKESS